MARPGRNPFELLDEPRTGRELIWWALFEHRRLEAFGDRIGRWRGLVAYLSAAPLILLIGVLLWLIGLAITVGLELPMMIEGKFFDDWVDVFTRHQYFVARYEVVIARSWVMALGGIVLTWSAMVVAVLLWGALRGLYIAESLAVSLGMIMALGFTLGLAGGRALGAPAGLTWGAAWGVAWGLAWGVQLARSQISLPLLTLGLLLTILAGMASSMAWSLAWIMIGGVPFSLASGLAGGPPLHQQFGMQFYLAGDFAMGIGVTIGASIGFFRLPIYLPEAIAALFRLDLRHNPYLRDVAIWLPIWGARRRLTDEARQDPATGSAFADFLLEHRPLQRGLAAEVLHAVQAGRWAMQPLEPLALKPPRLVEETPRFRPSDSWLSALAELREQLTAARQQTQPSLHRDAQVAFILRLDAFRQQTLQESPRWARHYLPAIDAWRAEAAKELAGLEDQARLLEPITANVYRPGDPLRPGADAGLFLGREDLRAELARAVLTPRELPLLLVQGQRRVGKTSLLNFLPDLLGPGFRVVYQDLQAGAVASVPAWLADLRRRVAEAVGESQDDWRAPEDWLAAWTELEPWLVAAAERAGRRLILAFDEYEALHDYLAAEPARGARLLAAIRSFTQHQARVCLLFAGATPFSELRDPDWARFFVQAVRLRVDYLDRASALKLITDPVPSMRYPPQVPARLWELTVGHPALLQRLCKELVDIANRDGRRVMTMADLDEALARGIDRETAAMERFWNEFCAAPACRDCIDAILAGRDPDADPALISARMRLAEHGYIVADSGRWRLRVPLFEDWLRRYRVAFGR
jgi:hypothetical protein